VGAVIFHDFVIHSILTNVILNFIILGTAAGGALLILHRLRIVKKEWQVFEQFSECDPEAGSRAQRLQLKAVASRLLVTLTRIRRKKEASAMEQSQIQEELNDVHRVLESRQEVAQYVVGLMIALGLLGTFIGLLETLVAVGDLIGGFSTVDPSQDIDKALGQLIGNLKTPLVAMGTAFSASMFGLLCSVTLGLMMLSVRAFQVEFLQFARSVVDGISGRVHKPSADLAQGSHVSDDAIWMSRIDDLQQSQMSLHEEVREIAMQGNRNQARQGALLFSVESMVSLAQNSVKGTQTLESHLAVLPVLLHRTEEAQHSTGQLIETMTQLLRQSDQRQHSLMHNLVHQIGEFAFQSDRSHAEHARRVHDALTEVLDQRLASAEAHSVRANELNRAALHQNEVLERVLSAFGDASSGMSSRMRRLHLGALKQAQSLQRTAHTMTTAITQTGSQVEKLCESLLTSRGDATGELAAYEIAKGAERLEREMRIGLSAMLKALRDMKMDAPLDAEGER
jgi:biopolymer transport protein ExbB/TolQ